MPITTTTHSHAGEPLWAGEWLAETLGVPVEQAIQEWEFDGRQFKRLKAENEKA